MGSKVFWAVVLAFLAGVFARSFLPLGWTVAELFALIGGAVLLLWYIERKQPLIILSVVCLACAAGIVRADTAALRGNPLLTSRLGTKIAIEGTIVAEPDVRDTSVRVVLRPERLTTPAQPLSSGADVIAALPAHTDVAYGERVRLTGTLTLPQSFDTGAGRSFLYPQYLAKDGIGYELDRAQFEKVTDGELKIIGTPNFFTAAAIGAKQWYLRGIAATLPEPEAGLAGGITVGDKRSVGSEVSAAFQRDSLVHMVVLSGYNITVVINFVRWSLQLFPRMLQVGGIFSAVCFFVLMTGGASSAVRSGLMALIAVYARASGRLFLAERALAAVSLAMVAWNPLTLAFDPSFQLSALATLGLILFTPHLASRMGWLTERFGLREIASSTLATQLMVLPLLLYQNGLLSLVELPANLLALFPVPLAMLFSLIAGAAGMIAGSLAIPVAFPAYALLAYIIAIARVLASLPFAAVSVPTFNFLWVVFAYALLFAGYWYLERGKVFSV